MAVRDLVYLLLTLAFFGLMLAYVRGCERLGRDASGEERPMSALTILAGVLAVLILAYLVYSLLRPEKF